MQLHLRVVTLAPVLALIACVADGVSADRVLLRTRSFVSGGNQAFSVAPNGSFLLFVSSITSDVPQFVLLDLQTLGQQDVEIAADTAPTRPLVDPGRWSRDSREVFLEDDAGGYLVVNVAEARARRAPAVPPFETEAAGVTFRQVTPTEVEVSVDGHVVASHQVQGAINTSAAAGLASRSTDRQWVSYVVQSSTGSVLGNGAGYVVNVARNAVPRRLSGNIISSIRFTGERQSIYALRRAPDGAYEIVEWQLE